jgi:HEAT repeat protein
MLNALSVQATRDDGETLIALLGRDEAGGARQLIAFAIGGIEYSAAASVLVRLLADPQVAGADRIRNGNSKFPNS